MNKSMDKTMFGEEARTRSLHELGYATIKELESELGILASGRDELYGCVFGRDSLITSMELLKAYERSKDPYLPALVKKVLANLISLQGRETNIESGEEPGKCIHEYRPSNHEHLTKALVRPWYVYPDGAMRNYDSVDATPLLLIALHEYFSITKDGDFMNGALPAAKAGLEWLLTAGDSNGDSFIDYRLDPARVHGGLVAQSWMDSAESVFREDGAPVAFPIAPVEVQAYAYAALRRWAEFFGTTDPGLARRLVIRADLLKEKFNRAFVVEEDGRGLSVAFAIDGNGVPLTAVRSTMGHILWAGWRDREGILDGIMDGAFVPKVAARLMEEDLFVPDAGVRTLSARSAHFDHKSYHNGSIWPHDTAMILGGLEKFGYASEAASMRRALTKAYAHFGTPLELFIFADGSYGEYCSATGQHACQKQAWSAAALLADTDMGVE